MATTKRVRTWLICRVDGKDKAHALSVSAGVTAKSCLERYWDEVLSKYDYKAPKYVGRDKLIVTDKQGNKKTYQATAP
jgi:hypothetical protein